MGKTVNKDISKNFSSKYNQKHLELAKNLLQMHLTLLQKEQF